MKDKVHMQSRMLQNNTLGRQSFRINPNSGSRNRQIQDYVMQNCANVPQTSQRNFTQN